MKKFTNQAVTGTAEVDVAEIETFSNSEPFYTMTDKHSVASPDVFCRTGLFGASAQRQRELLKPNQRVVVACDPSTGYQVMLEGGLNCNIPGPLGDTLLDKQVSSRLDQTDYSVYLALLRLTNGMLGSTAVFEPYAFVKSLGLADNKSNVRSTFESIARMNATRLTVVQPKHSCPGKFMRCVGFLVSSVAYDDETGRYNIALDPQLAGLFQKSYFNQLAWEQRLALPSSLAKWLHAELNSHRSGYRRWSHRLQQAFGSQSSERLFRARLRDAVDEVRQVTGWDVRLESNAANYNLQLVCFKSPEDANNPELQSENFDDEAYDHGGAVDMPVPAVVASFKRPGKKTINAKSQAAAQGVLEFA